MPASAAARILGAADARAAGGVMMELPRERSVQLLATLSEPLAVAMLSFVEPATVAALLSPMNGANRRLLAHLAPPFRALVVRYLPDR
jgi:hypothetical protein